MNQNKTPLLFTHKVASDKASSDKAPFLERPSLSSPLPSLSPPSEASSEPSSELLLPPKSLDVRIEGRLLSGPTDFDEEEPEPLQEDGFRLGSRRPLSIEPHTFFVGLKEILPEDVLFRKTNPSVPALICLQEDAACTCPFRCIPKLLSRLLFLFEKLKVQNIFILFRRKENALQRQRALLFEEAPSSKEGHESRERALEKVEVARIWIARFSQRLGADGSPPYTLSRVNLAYLNLFLERATETQVFVPFRLWEGN